MEKIRKVSLVLGIAAFIICGAGLDLLGGIALTMNNYEKCGYSLMASAGVFLPVIVLAFFKKTWTDIASLILNAAATLLYIYPITVLNAIPNAAVPKESVAVLTGRIYPSAAITVLLAVVCFADLLSYEKMTQREQRRQKKLAERDRRLTDEEKIL